MTRAIYLVGGPGSGKSTVMNHLLEGWETGPYVRLTEKQLFGHYLSGEDAALGVYLGQRREQFPGTDSLSMSVLQIATDWISEGVAGVDYLFGEGTRLAQVPFFTELHARTDLLVVHLLCPPEVAEERKAERGYDATFRWRLRKTEAHSPGWLAGQWTRAGNLVKRTRDLGIRVAEVDTTQSSAEKTADLIRLLH